MHCLQHITGGQLVEAEIECPVRIARRDVGIGGKVEHFVKPYSAEQAVQGTCIQGVKLFEGERLVARQMRDVALAAEMKIIDAPHLSVPRQQPVAQMATDKAGGACYQNPHI